MEEKKRNVDFGCTEAEIPYTNEKVSKHVTDPFVGQLYAGPIWTICPKIVPLPWTIIYAKFPKDVLSLCFFSEQTAWICRVLISPVNCPSLSDIGLSNRPALLIIYVELMYAYWPQNVESKPVGLIHTQEVFGIKVWHYKSDLPNVIRKKERILTYW